MKKQHQAPERAIPVAKILFWPTHTWSGPGFSQHAIESKPSPNKFHYLIHHYPGRRQIRAVGVHPGRPDKTTEEWIPDTAPRAIVYVEPTYRQED